MRKAPLPKNARAARRYLLPLLSAVVVSLPGCTDLGEKPLSAITPENFFRNEAEVIGGLATVYAELRGSLWAYYNLSEISSDEIIIPTRGQDWYDNGRWLEIHRQLWEPNSPSALVDLNDAWVNAFTGVARANLLLSSLQNVTVANQEVIEAEVRTLRAFYYYMLMDLFGGVQIVTTTEIKPRPRNTRAEVFQFIEQELLETREILPAKWPDASHGRLTQGAADAILANMYLNAGVFTKDQGINASDYNSCTQVDIGGQNACEAAVAAANRILNSGVYSLAADWTANFRHDNHLSPENILVVKHLNQPGLGLNFIYRALHYHQATPQPWNGFATIAETYYAFDRDDLRDTIFLVGQQVNVETGEPVNDRSGQPLFFTPEIEDATSATESEGVRIYKWPADPNHVGADHSNDYAYFRLAEIILIKAEALNELGRTAEALVLVNQLRDRVFDTPEPIVAGTQEALRAAILNERLFELTAEAKRRQDLIRFGEFTAPWSFKDQREAHRVLMPIPQRQIGANPLLEQNPGY